MESNPWAPKREQEAKGKGTPRSMVELNRHLWTRADHEPRCDLCRRIGGSATSLLNLIFDVVYERPLLSPSDRREGACLHLANTVGAEQGNR